MNISAAIAIRGQLYVSRFPVVLPTNNSRTHIPNVTRKTPYVIDSRTSEISWASSMGRRTMTKIVPMRGVWGG